jgi:hypothetical protein
MNVSDGCHRSLDRRPVVRLLHLRHQSIDQCQRTEDPRPTPLTIRDEGQFKPEAVQWRWPRS